MSSVNRTDPVGVLRHALRRTPLRIKLVASVLVLVTVALFLISVASAVALRSYLIGRIDDDLRRAVGQVSDPMPNPVSGGGGISLSDYFVVVTDTRGQVLRDDGGRTLVFYNNRELAQRDLAPWPNDHEEIVAHHGVPYTARAQTGKLRWRVLVTQLDGGPVVTVGRDLSDVDSAVTRLVWIDVLVGGSVLAVLAVVGVGLVRTSLRPLVEIERTAAAIAGGDLSQRVPDPEPGEVVPRTELGRLSRALNAMLSQIESAFTARAASETAARAAESAARDAAVAARSSEGRARRSEERMRQFVADASHELRTPLTTIRGFAELYRQGAAAAPAETARVIRRIEDEAARMGLLVEDLLLLARLDRERPLDRGPVDLRVLAADAVQAAHAVDPERRVELAVSPDAGPLVISGDEARLRQVIANLMSNALTHTPPDASVTVRLYRSGDPPLAVFEVADTGPGLAPEHRDRVFERFYRADAARTRKTSGSTGAGLGLAIVAALVAAHGGSVEVTSDPGEGATFTVRLPLAESGLTGDFQASPR